MFLRADHAEPLRDAVRSGGVSHDSPDSICSLLHSFVPYNLSQSRWCWLARYGTISLLCYRLKWTRRAEKLIALVELSYDRFSVIYYCLEVNFRYHEILDQVDFDPHPYAFWLLITSDESYDNWFICISLTDDLYRQLIVDQQNRAHKHGWSYLLDILSCGN